MKVKIIIISRSSDRNNFSVFECTIQKNSGRLQIYVNVTYHFEPMEPSFIFSRLIQRMKPSLCTHKAAKLRIRANNKWIHMNLFERTKCRWSKQNECVLCTKGTHTTWPVIAVHILLVIKLSYWHNMLPIYIFVQSDELLNITRDKGLIALLLLQLMVFFFLFIRCVVCSTYLSTTKNFTQLLTNKDHGN